MNPNFEHRPIFTLTLRNRTLHLTREGGGFIVLVFGIGIGAINTGNNLLYLILAMCCSFIAVSGILSEQTLKDISAEGSLPSTIYLGDTYPIPIKLHNGKRRLPSYSLYIEFPTDYQSDYRVESSPYFFQISGGATMEKSALLTATKRGPLKIRTCRLRTSFPFGFFVKTKSIPFEADCIVFPQIKPMELPRPSELSEEGEGKVSPSGDDLYSLREFRPGDSMSTVHWKSSAKTGSLRVREFSRGGTHSFTLFLNIEESQTNRPVTGDILEQRISETASLAYHLIRRGDEVRLKIHEYESSMGNSESHLHSLLTYLALFGLKNAVTQEATAAHV